jgi:lipoyl(octanoyl) transferase
MKTEIIDLGYISYPEAHTQMRDCLQSRIQNKCPDTLLLCEHPPVYTIGRHRGAEKNLLLPGDTPVISVERGGDITFHGPGQLVGYPIVQLPEHRHDILAFLRGLENFWIQILREQFGLPAMRDDRNTGVWIEDKKIIAIGIACRQWTTWHGFAWNLSVDLSHYKNINPCGMSSDLVTSMTEHQHSITIERAKDIIAREFPTWWEKWRAKTD